MSIKKWLKGAALGSLGLLTLPYEADAQTKTDNELPKEIEQRIEDKKSTYLLHENDLDGDGEQDIFITSVMHNPAWSDIRREIEALEQEQREMRHNTQEKTHTTIFYRTPEGTLEKHIYKPENPGTLDEIRGPAGIWVTESDNTPVYVTTSHELSLDGQKGEAAETYEWDDDSNGFLHHIYWKESEFEGLEYSPVEEDLWDNESYHPLGKFDDGELYPSSM